MTRFCGAPAEEILAVRLVLCLFLMNDYQKSAKWSSLKGGRHEYDGRQTICGALVHINLHRKHAPGITPIYPVIDQQRSNQGDLLPQQSTKQECAEFGVSGGHLFF